MSATIDLPAPAAQATAAHAADPSIRPVTQEAVSRYHELGFCSAPALLPRAEAERYRTAALAFSATPERVAYTSSNPVFTQLVNVWREDAELRSLTFHPLITAAVHALSRGRPMRLWHDHLLIKRPQNGAASEFHQDLPYWPFDRQTFTISAWVALGDAPVERGCMSFIPGSHLKRDLRAQNLADANDLPSLWPEMVFEERVVMPLSSGGVTFHQGCTAHRAGPNTTDHDRVAMSIIWVAADAPFNGADHCVTQDLGLEPGMLLPDHRCPPV